MVTWLGRVAYRWRWGVLGAWAVVAVLGVLLGGQVFDRLATVDSVGSGAESTLAQRRIDQLLPEGAILTAAVRTADLYDPALVASVTQISGEISAMTGVLSVDDLYTNRSGAIGTDNASTLLLVEIDTSLPESDREALEDRVVAALHRIEPADVLVGGETLAERSFGEQALRDAAVGETLALILVFIALVLILGGVLPASLPVLVAVTAISTTLLALLALSRITTVSEFAINVVTLLGFGLAVDYAMLLIFRYREERRTRAVPEALTAMTATAGRTVLFAGSAVATCIGGLAVFAVPLLRSMAIAGAVVVLLVTLCSVTLVPALLAIAGARIRPAGSATRLQAVLAGLLRRVGLRDADPQRPSLLPRLAAYAQARPWQVAVAATVGLLFLASPFFGANLGNSDARSLPASTEARQAYEAIQAGFPAASAATVTVVIEAPAASAQVRDFLNLLMTVDGVRKVEPDGDTPPEATVVDLTTTGDSGGSVARQVVRDVRALDAPFGVMVAGPAAEVVDFQDAVGVRLPAAALWVLMAGLIILFALTRSIIIMVKALVLNALTLGATLGTLVILFQWGLGEGLLRFDSYGGLDLTTPILLLVFVFGLTMDYELFLLSRIQEEWERHGDNDRAVLGGIRASGRVVTSAALCLSIVFLGFVVSDLVALKEIGAGMVVAILLDVIVVRGLLLPATMTLFGRWNWWSPAALRMPYSRDGHIVAQRTSEPADLESLTEVGHSGLT
jgi:RND superfamily putative drug exporter